MEPHVDDERCLGHKLWLSMQAPTPHSLPHAHAHSHNTQPHTRTHTHLRMWILVLGDAASGAVRRLPRGATVVAREPETLPHCSHPQSGTPRRYQPCRRLARRAMPVSEWWPVVAHPGERRGGVCMHGSMGRTFAFTRCNADRSSGGYFQSGRRPSVAFQMLTTSVCPDPHNTIAACNMQPPNVKLPMPANQRWQQRKNNAPRTAATPVACRRLDNA